MTKSQAPNPKEVWHASWDLGFGHWDFIRISSFGFRIFRYTVPFPNEHEASYSRHLRVSVRR
jgi:hypothetical protein